MSKRNAKSSDDATGDDDLTLERLRRHLAFLGLTRTLDELVSGSRIASAGADLRSSAMIKKAQKNGAQKPQMAVLAPVDLTRVAGGDPPGSKIRETLTGG